MKSRLTFLLVCGGLIAFLVDSPVGRPPADVPSPGGNGNSGDGLMLLPPIVTIDQIIHNQGNIVTTVDNWGYIGGYQYYDYPSGEWPRNSGHDYIGELKYWMGVITAGGDTLVANSIEDFQGLPSLVAGEQETKILLSTDTTRYYDYDLTDTTGLGSGNPARGWRVWDNDSETWVYDENYNPLDSTFFEGGPIAVQESHYRFNDASLGSSLLGLEMTHTILQWNYCYNEDFLFVILDIKNTSTEDYTDFAFGLYIDIDVGGPDGTGENGRLEDMVAFDSTENLAWTYDSLGVDPGWGQEVATGIMGTKYIETPDGIGMTGFRTGDWALVPDYDDDPGMFDLINSPQFDTSLAPTDQYYIQCTRGISLEAGKTVRVVYALIAGQDEAEFRANATMAQQLYDNYFVGPEPPVMPTLSAVPGDNKVSLHWNDTAQYTIDPLSGENDFAGYKLYRSDDRGITWGEENRDFENNCQDIDYFTIAQYSVIDPSDPVPHSFIDTGLINGVEYWYCLVSYDTGASETGVDMLQSGFGIPEGALNVLRVTPRTDPAGFLEAAGTVEHQYNGTVAPSEGEVIPAVFDPSQLLGADYRVVFEDALDRTCWHLINETTGDTVLADQTRFDGEPGLYDVVEGLRVVVRGPDRVPVSMEQTELGGTEETLINDPYSFYGSTAEFFLGEVFSDASLRPIYEFRYTGNSTLAPAINDGVGMGMAWSVPFEVWNTDNNERVALAVYDFGLDGAWDSWDLLIVINYPYDPVTDPFTTAWPYYFSWMFGLDYTVYNPTVGDVFTIEGPRLNSPDDVFLFKADGVNDARARAELKNIKVVPDPYYAHADLWEVDGGEHVLQFQNLPADCTVRIYTLAGDLVKTLENTDGSGTVEWDLLSGGQQLIASGIYFYHVESRHGERLGRFAVIM